MFSAFTDLLTAENNIEQVIDLSIMKSKAQITMRYIAESFLQVTSLKMKIFLRKLITNQL